MTLQKIVALSGHLSQIGALLAQKSSNKEGFPLPSFQRVPIVTLSLQLLPAEGLGEYYVRYWKAEDTQHSDSSVRKISGRSNRPHGHHPGSPSQHCRALRTSPSTVTCDLRSISLEEMDAAIRNRAQNCDSTWTFDKRAAHSTSGRCQAGFS